MVIIIATPPPNETERSYTSCCCRKWTSRDDAALRLRCSERMLLLVLDRRTAAALHNSLWHPGRWHNKNKQASGRSSSSQQSRRHTPSVKLGSRLPARSRVLLLPDRRVYVPNVRAAVQPQPRRAGPALAAGARPRTGGTRDPWAIPGKAEASAEG